MCANAKVLQKQEANVRKQYQKKTALLGIATGYQIICTNRPKVENKSNRHLQVQYEVGRCFYFASNRVYQNI